MNEVMSVHSELNLYDTPSHCRLNTSSQTRSWQPICTISRWSWNSYQNASHNLLYLHPHPPPLRDKHTGPFHFSLIFSARSVVATYTSPVTSEAVRIVVKNDDECCTTDVWHVSNDSNRHRIIQYRTLACSFRQSNRTVLSNRCARHISQNQPIQSAIQERSAFVMFAETGKKQWIHTMHETKDWMNRHEHIRNSVNCCKSKGIYTDCGEL